MSNLGILQALRVFALVKSARQGANSAEATLTLS
jgi:hypothetical protein